MTRRSSSSVRAVGTVGRRLRPVRGAHASRAVVAASGGKPVGIEALGRFDAMLVLVRAGNVSRESSAIGGDACAPWKAQWLDQAAASPPRLDRSARSGSRRTVGLASRGRMLGASASAPCGAGPNQCVVRWPVWQGETRHCPFLNLKEGVGLGTGAAVPGMAHAILEACG